MGKERAIEKAMGRTWITIEMNDPSYDWSDFSTIELLGMLRSQNFQQPTDNWDGVDYTVAVENCKKELAQRDHIPTKEERKRARLEAAHMRKFGR